MLLIRKRTLEAIRSHAVSTYPEECCGFLFGARDADARTVAEAVPTRNTIPSAAERTRRYTYDPLDLVHAEDRFAANGHVHVGFYHSHPDHPARPSEFDREHSAWPGQSYVVISVEKRTPAEITSWALAEDRTFIKEELIEQP